MYTLKIHNALNHWGYFLENEVGGGGGSSRKTRKAALAAGSRSTCPDSETLKVEEYKFFYEGADGKYRLTKTYQTTFGALRPEAAR
jgi:hypothetical protein